jgi:hypothetical protein
MCIIDSWRITLPTRVAPFPSRVRARLYEGLLVILRKQFQSTDAVWHDLLQHVQERNCSPKRLKPIQGLLPTGADGRRGGAIIPEDCKSGVLITSQHIVRTLWNELANRQHCAETGRGYTQWLEAEP